MLSLFSPKKESMDPLLTDRVIGVGVDFGTTNSVVAPGLRGRQRALPRLAPRPRGDGDVPTPR